MSNNETGSYPKDPMIDPYNQNVELRKRLSEQAKELKALQLLTNKLLERIMQLKAKLEDK